MINVKRFSHATFETPDLERQIDYFTQSLASSLAGRENGRAFSRPRSATSWCRSRRASEARCARLAFQVDPDTDFGDIRAGSRPRRHALRDAQRRGARRSEDASTFEDPKGTASKCSPSRSRSPRTSRSPASARSSSGIWRSASTIQEIRRFLRPRAGLPGLRLDRGLVRLHALRPGPPHRQLRARQAHEDASRRLRAEGLGADPDTPAISSAARISS